MSKEEIIEGNKLIAVFDGYRVIKNHPEYEWACTYHPTIDLAAVADHQLKFHSSWGWLMPVVEKIEASDIGGLVSIYGIFCTISDEDIPTFTSRDGKTKIENTWLTIIQFIKWYNENKNS
jgi:hypothetical protein